MKVNRKYLPKISRPQDYIQFTNTLFNLARQQNELIPHSLEFEVTICGQMIELSCNAKPPFYVGASCGPDLETDKMFAESLGLDLHNYLKSR
jgi:hypothetical protein